jgi:hypothetical protein
VPALQRIQVQFQLPYNRQAQDDEHVRSYLARGWRIAQLQRLSDHEALITFEADGQTSPS